MKAKQYFKSRRWWHHSLLGVFLLFIGLISGTAVTTADSFTGEQSTWIEIDPASAHLAGKEATITLNAIVHSAKEDGPVTWSVNDSAQVALEPAGSSVVVTALVDYGEAVVTATFDEFTAEAIIVIGPRVTLNIGSAMLTGEGDVVTVLATVQDPGSFPDVVPEVEWQVSDPDVIAIEESGNLNEIMAVAKVEVGSATVTALYDNVSASAHIVVATIGEETYVIESETIEDVSYLTNAAGVIQSIVATLDSTPANAQIEPGQILVGTAVSDQMPALLIRVTEIEVREKTGSITVYGQIASLAEAYENLSMHFEYDPFGSTTGGLKALETMLPELITCETSTHLAEVTITSLRASTNGFPIKPVIDVDVSNHEIEKVFIGVDVDVDVSLLGPTLDVSGEATYEFECQLPLPLDLIGIDLEVPIPNTPLSVAISPKIGVKGEVSMEYGSYSVTLGSLIYKYNARFGLTYENEQWYKVSEHSEPIFEAELFKFDTQPGGSFSGKWYPHVGAELTLGVLELHDAGHIRILNGRFGNMNEASIPLQAVLFDPKPPNSLYDDPTWSKSKLLRVELDLGVGGILGDKFTDILRHFGPDMTPVAFETPRLLELEELVGETPAITLTVDNPTIAPGIPVELTTEIRPFGSDTLVQYVYVGRPVEFWASRNDLPAFPIGTTTVDADGNASWTWTPTEAGSYEVAALVYDRLTGLISLPYQTDSIFSTPLAIKNFDVDPNAGIAPQDATFSWQVVDSNGNAVSCTLDPGDGTTPYVIADCLATSSQAHTFDTAGSYTAVLTADNGTITTTATLAINIAANNGSLAWTYPLTGLKTGVPLAMGQNGNLYFAKEDGTGVDRVVAIDPAGPYQLWETSMIDSELNVLAVGDDDTVYAGVRGHLYGLNPSNGSIVFNATPWPSYREVVDIALSIDGNLYVTLNNGDIVAVSSTTAGALWQYSPTSFVNDIVVAQSGKIYLQRADKLQQLHPDGTPGWDVPIAATGLAIDSDESIYAVEDGFLHRISNSGTIQWSMPLTYGTGSVSNVTSPVIGYGSTIYFTGWWDEPDQNSHFGACAVDSNAQVLHWCFEVNYEPTPLALGDDGLIYVADGTHEIGHIALFALNPDGTVAWAYVPSGYSGTVRPTSPLVGTGGVVYFGGFYSGLHALNTDSLAPANTPWPRYGHDNQNSSRAQ